MNQALRPLFWLALVAALIIAALPQPLAVPGQPSDKVQHIIAFVVLSALGAAAYPRASVWTLMVGMSAFGALIEIVQLIPALNRTSELYDWIADTAAAAVTLVVILVARRRLARKSVRKAAQE